MPLPGKEEEQAKRSKQEIVVPLFFVLTVACTGMFFIYMNSLTIFNVKVPLDNRKRAEFLRQSGDTSEANKVLSASVQFDHNLVLQFIHVRVLRHKFVF